MRDKQMLELAAKAAGYQVARVADDGESLMLVGVQEPWNPRDDDGQALRLAVKLRISVESDAAIEVGFDPVFGGEYVMGCEAWIVHNDGATTKAQEVYGSDPGAATRKAVVRVAGELGRAMP